jgi:hypothetical protein
VLLSVDKALSLALLCLVAAGGLASERKPPPPVPWSFAPLKRVELPTVKNTPWPQTRIDWFILSKLEAAGLSPSPRADERTLQRRLSFDLLGLPPKQMKSASWKDLVDQTLARPQYGERWARHWLDLARYVDETPDWLDSTKYSYLYRDWVVKALNDDMPYDEFVQRQLAVDYLPGTQPADLVALGFLGLSPTYFKELQLPPDIIKTTVADEWEEHVDAVGRTFLGLTIACARCHDHKADPITAADYYALAGVFASIKLSERPLVDDAIWAPVAKAREEVAGFEKKLAELKKAKQKTADLKEQVIALEQKMSLIKTSTPHYNIPMANAVEEAALFVVDADNKKGTKLDFRAGMSRDLEFQKRGDPNDTGEVVARRFLSAFPSKSGKPRRFVQGSGRLELAEALIDEAAPLTARVMVNRVWKHHFGRGLVDTPSEFGNSGEIPTHPELLDDLAARFIEHGWSLKWLHREILTSATWQQASVSAESEKQDPENKLYSRMTRRRLDWESWRDAMLNASGLLDSTMGGPASVIADLKHVRRSLYGASNRQDMEAMMRIHDVPDPGAHSPSRPETITPLQGLFALNSPFMHQQADTLAKRLLSEPSSERVTVLYHSVLQRPPAPNEQKLLTDFMSGREAEIAAWAQCAQALLAGNEFLFLD